MTQAQLRILELFRRLDPAEQREVFAQLGETPSGYEGLTVAQLAMLDEGVSQAERGDTVPAEEAFTRLADRFNFPRA